MTEATKADTPRIYRFSGANFQRQNQIRKLAEEGMEVQEIADTLNIEPTCVASFVKQFRAELKPATAKKTPRKTTKKAASKEPEVTEEDAELYS